MQIEKQEGELYKKLIEIGRKAYIPCAGQEKTVIVPYLQVLDEAKQDFPDWHNPRGIGKTFTAFENEVIDWFKKWFGES